MTIFFILILTLWTVFGDFLIKKASQMPGFSGWYFLLGGCFVWAGTAVLCWQLFQFIFWRALHNSYKIQISMGMRMN